jgi:hypothetical protein
MYSNGSRIMQLAITVRTGAGTLSPSLSTTFGLRSLHSEVKNKRTKIVIQDYDVAEPKDVLSRYESSIPIEIWGDLE